MNNFNPKDKRPNDQQPKMPKFNMNWLYISVLIFIAVIAFSGGGNLLGVQGVSQEATYTKFKEYVSKGYASRIIINNQEHELKMYVKPQALKAVFNQPAEKLGKDPYVKVNYGSVDKIEDFLLTAQKSGKLKDYDYERPNENTLLNLLYNFGPFLLLIFVWFFFMNRMNSGGAGGGVFNVGKSKAKLYEKAGEMGVTFKDVAGQEGAKQEVAEIVEFLKNPEKFTELGGKIPKGALLIGPPGTGKTLLAKAVAGEADVPFFSMSGSDFVEMFVGMGASKVRDLFKQAGEKAPCIVFIDEIDTIGKKRDGGANLGGNDEREQTLNQLLTEMDGFDAAKGVVILAATNRPESLDPALTRPGRFDRRVPVELPDLKGRESILRLHAKKVRLGPDCDFSVIARMTPGASGAELANIVNEAALCAVRHRRKAVTQFDLQEAVDTILAGAQKKNKILNNKEKCIVSYHEVGHALVAALQTNSAPVQKITIVPRTSGALGFTMQVEDGDHTLMTKEEILNKIATLTGGRAAEELIFHSITTGASNDIEQATKLARALVTRYGMTEDFDMVALETVNNAYLGGDASLACSEQTAAKVDAKVVEIVQAEHRKAYKLLADNKRKLDEIAQYLYEKETISGEEFMRILNAQPQLPAETSADSTNAVQ